MAQVTLTREMFGWMKNRICNFRIGFQIAFLGEPPVCLHRLGRLGKPRFHSSAGAEKTAPWHNRRSFALITQHLLRADATPGNRARASGSSRRNARRS